MKITVKTLKGGKFQIETEPSNTVAEAKGLIEAAKSELPAASMKLIHSGKVLKDDDTIESCNIKPNDFLVVMITKAKKAPTPAPAAEPAHAPAPKAEGKTSDTPAPASAAASSAPAADAPAPAAAAPAAPAPAAAADEFPPEVVSNLTGMGFPDPEVRACLRASGGNPDVAVEFLMNGIPPGVQAMQQASSSGSAPPPAAASSSTGATGSGGEEPLAALRNHPQFDALRRLVQSNPSMLQAVLTQIGQQQPDLLQAINSNQEEFLRMMNEPISEDAPAPAPGAPAPAPSSGPGSGGAGVGGGMPPGLLEGIGDPAQMAQMIQSMGEPELAQMAAMMGITPDQLRTTAQAIGQMPPEQFQQFMSQAMGGAGGMGAMGGGEGGPQMIRLTEEEMAAVDRLAEMGFDRSEAAQAFLACDKNEALAANLLMDGGFGFGADDTGGGAGGGSRGDDEGGAGGNDNDDAMYD